MERVELARRLGATAYLGEPPAGPTLIEEADPRAFMARFGAAVAGGGEVFLVDPGWRAAERALLADHLRQSSVAGRTGRGWLMIPSGGSSGALRFARHDEETLAAAVRGFCAHFGFERVNALGVLPLHHVSGLMAWMRCALSGGEYRPQAWKALESGERPALEPGDWIISLVPTQLQRLLEEPGAVAWLRTFRAVFLGGGPAWPHLLDAAARAGVPLALTYGMTETAAMVTALRPQEFLEGGRSSGTALPHARVGVSDDGTVVVGGESLFRGYFPGWRPEREFATGDIGILDTAGRLTVLGRRDAVVITGGKKVDPDEVEAVLRASGEFADVAVVGVPDERWGEVVVACYPAGTREPDLERVARVLERELAGHQRPKRFVALAGWPRTAQGKINRAALRETVVRDGEAGEPFAGPRA
jgi:o-succinylbenzoate---CoA ligase